MFLAENPQPLFMQKYVQVSYLENTDKYLNHKQY